MINVTGFLWNQTLWRMEGGERWGQGMRQTAYWYSVLLLSPPYSSASVDSCPVAGTNDAKEVAVKRLHAQASKSDRVALLREVDTLCRLEHHPNIVRVVRLQLAGGLQEWVRVVCLLLLGGLQEWGWVVDGSEGDS